MSQSDDLNIFLNNKTEYTLSLFHFFIDEVSKIGPIKLTALKTMIAIESEAKFAYVTQLGKDFIHVVLPFGEPFNDNLCFTKIAQVPNTQQYNHHLRIYLKDDINDEVISFLKMAYHHDNQ